MYNHSAAFSHSAAPSHSAAIILADLLTILLAGVRTSCGCCAVALGFSAIRCLPETLCHHELQNPRCGLSPEALQHPAQSTHICTAGVCLVLTTASLSSSSPKLCLLFSYSFSPHRGAEPGLVCCDLPRLWPSRSRHSFQQPPHLYLWLTPAPTEGLFPALLLICRVWWSIQMNRNPNCRVSKQHLDYITAFVF